MEIRLLRDADLPLVIALAHRIWPHAYAGVLTPEQIANILGAIYTRANLEAEIDAGHRFWAAYVDETPLGFASGYRDDDVVWLKKLYVSPEAQGRGIGRALVATILGAFGPAREARLLVNNGNAAAQDAYVRLGFTKAGDVPVQMGDYAFTDYLYVKRL